MQNSFNVAIVGATGIVGSKVLSILEERKFPVKNLFLLASERSAGESKEFNFKTCIVHDLSLFDFSQTQIAFFCTSNEISHKYAPIAAALGNVVIDKSSFFRNHPDVPLIVPEVNSEALALITNKKIIANPNCSTIPLVMVLKPLKDAVGISRINIATYQSVSGSGKDGVTELAQQTNDFLNGNTIHCKIYPQPIAFNVLPHIDNFEDNGYTKEEMKVVWETQKILNDYDLAINPTAVRVPVFYGHSAAVHIETKNKISVSQAMEILKATPGVRLISGSYPYPTPVHDAAGKDEVYVGRIREDISHANGLNFWVVSDNIRKGAALNAVQIAEKLIEIGAI